MMRYRSVSALLIVVAVSSLQVSASDAATLRWSSQGDAVTFDPHAQNEAFTTSIIGQVYERLILRDPQMNLVPGLAVSWKQTAPNVWIFNLRKGVRFQDGSPFTADDVVFSIERAQQPTSNMRVYSSGLGKPRRIDDYTVELITAVPNPVMLETLSAPVAMMSRAWCEQHQVTRPQDFKAKEETYAVSHAMGTGPYILVSREPDVKTVFRKNPGWWGIADGRFTGNVDEVVYRPIKSAGTRVAALLSGEMDLVLDPPVQDVPRLEQDSALKVWKGREKRVIFVGMDEARDELLYSDVKGRNPFKDRRVRLAMYQAVDVEAIKTSVMRGLSIPTAINLPAPKEAGIPDSMDKRYPHDPDAARKLLAEAGYPDGFGVTMDCPNDRYINDEKICVALASMWAKIGVRVKVNAMPKANYFPKENKLDTSLYLAGWGTFDDAIFTLKPVMHSRNDRGGGESNYGNISNARLDTLIDRIEGEVDQQERHEEIVEAMKIDHDEVLHIPLHLQVIPWATRANVKVVHRPDNRMEASWVRVD
jgi:peptide/nickel transport system substrate-binding protein